MTSWELYAHKYKNFFMHVGPLNYVKAHMLKDEIKKVIVSLDDNGEYYGWLEKGENTPTMIWPSRAQFSMCFPYGYEAEEKRIKGKMVRLKIIEIKKDD
jgi:hypothetical protein